ncbi:MAG: 50S ribosomal protein L21 [Candidatus Neomarinimicrobiota bacterium]
MNTNELLLRFIGFFGEIMFAIINIAGKQFRVEKDDELKVPHLDTAEGKTLKFDKVLLTNDGKKVNLGSPLLDGASVSATVINHGRGRKIRIFKKKRRKGYRRNNGHRQNYSLIKIGTITSGKVKSADKEVSKEES